MPTRRGKGANYLDAVAQKALTCGSFDPGMHPRPHASHCSFAQVCLSLCATAAKLHSQYGLRGGPGWHGQGEDLLPDETERERDVKLHASLPAFVLHVTAGLELTTSHV